MFYVENCWKRCRWWKSCSVVNDLEKILIIRGAITGGSDVNLTLDTVYCYQMMLREKEDGINWMIVSAKYVPSMSQFQSSNERVITFQDNIVSSVNEMMWDISIVGGAQYCVDQWPAWPVSGLHTICKHCWCSTAVHWTLGHSDNIDIITTVLLAVVEIEMWWFLSSFYMISEMLMIDDDSDHGLWWGNVLLECVLPCHKRAVDRGAFLLIRP